MANVLKKAGAGLVLVTAVTLAGFPSRDTAAITITPNVPSDLATTDTTLSSAAAFAWNEFIALNWPAVRQTGADSTRDVADDTATFGVPNDPRPLVWHTFRSKVEIFSPTGSTPYGYATNSSGTNSYGYDSLPRYTYQNGVRPANGIASASVPWINLDETNEIGLDAMYAGVGTGRTALNGLILFTAKANRAEYEYVAANKYFDSATVANANSSSSKYVVANKNSPPPNTSANGVSLPNGTIELKAAWRELTTAEARSGRFYQTRVRYYANETTYVDTTMGLVALHIIQKTPSRPHFVFATFEQADNILSRNGRRVEDANGNLNPGFDTLQAMYSAPPLSVRSARSPAPNGYSQANIQRFSPDSANSTPGARLYYVNTPRQGQTEGIISINRRVRGIPEEIVEANTAAHAAMTQYAAAHGLPPAVWQYYKLINVQYQPIDKPTAGVNYTGADSATYYQANIVVETDHNLQTFSGRFQPGFVVAGTGQSTQATISGGNLITDWCGSNASSPIAGCPSPGQPGANGPIKNVYTGGKAYNMGGCMGCHGNAQVGGGDFSFLMVGGPVEAPEPADSVRAPLNNRKFSKIFGELRAVRGAARASPRRQ
ncbi:MAG TPA: hypothetical protein VF584_21705 [Longimicrobium sp.]|jgi:hypothetical protein